MSTTCNWAVFLLCRSSHPASCRMRVFDVQAFRHNREVEGSRQYDSGITARFRARTARVALLALAMRRAGSRRRLDVLLHLPSIGGVHENIGMAVGLAIRIAVLLLDRAPPTQVPVFGRSSDGLLSPEFPLSRPQAGAWWRGCRGLTVPIRAA